MPFFHHLELLFTNFLNRWFYLTYLHFLPPLCYTPAPPYPPLSFWNCSQQERKLFSIAQYNWHISLPTSPGLQAALEPVWITFLETVFFSTHTAYWFPSCLSDSCLSFSFPESFLYLPQKNTLSLGSTLTPHTLMASTTIPTLMSPKSVFWAQIDLSNIHNQPMR